MTQVLYQGAFGSHLIRGRWCVLAFWRVDDTEFYDFSEPMSYTECQARLLAHGQGVPWQEGLVANADTLHRVLHARIVPAAEAA